MKPRRKDHTRDENKELLKSWECLGLWGKGYN